MASALALLTVLPPAVEILWPLVSHNLHDAQVIRGDIAVLEDSRLETYRAIEQVRGFERLVLYDEGTAYLRLDLRTKT